MTHPSIEKARQILARTEAIDAEVLRRRLARHRAGVRRAQKILARRPTPPTGQHAVDPGLMLRHRRAVARARRILGWVQ